MNISIILPAYNEEETIAQLLEKIKQSLPKEYNVEIIVSNDGSLDKTAFIAQEKGAKVVSSPIRMGNGAAVKRGLRQASYDIVVLMDADGQHRPEDITTLLDVYQKGNYEMVVGQRMLKTQKFPRAFANAFYNWFASYVSGVKIKDLTSGFRVVNREKALEFLPLLPNSFSYPTTLTLAFIKSAYPVGFVPIVLNERKGGKSKINLFTDGMRFVMIITKIAVFFSPLKVFIPLSGIFFILGIGYYLYTFSTSHRFTNMSALLLTTAVIIFMLGLISEQIAQLFRMSENKHIKR